MSDAERTQSGDFFLKLWLVAFVLSGFCFTPNITLAAVSVTANITANTTWNASSSPYVIQGNLSVATGTTLTVGAGTVIKFAEQTSMRINGTLRVNGTASKRVYFTSLKDDIGGDTNANGAATKPAPQDWRTIVFAPGSTGQFNYSTIRYAGFFQGMMDTSPAIFNTGGSVTIANSEISNSSLFGVGQTAGSLNISSSTVKNNELGIAIKGGSVRLVGNTFDNTSTGVVDDGNNSLTLLNNTFLRHDQAIVFYLTKQRSIVESGNIANSNDYNGIVLAGVIKSAFTLQATKLPYLILNSGNDFGTGQLRFTPDNFNVSGTGSLTISSGVVIKFAPQANFPVYGKMTASGSTNSPVIFTSVYDNTVGGKALNGNNLPAKIGDWGDIKISKNANVNLSRTIIRYGGESQYNSGSLLFNQGGNLIINYSQILDSGQFGIRHISGTTTVRQSTFAGNQNYGILNESTRDVDAKSNYWGDPSGPSHSSNSAGLGDYISDKVLFKTWLVSPNVTAPNPPCCSSVLFLPGIMGTRLNGTSTKHWEPFGADDIKKLHLNVNGASIYNIRSGTVIAEFSLTNTSLDLNIYKTFLSDLDSAKRRGLISNYVAYGYDWRLSLSNILSDKKLLNTVKSTAALSKTGKVTIIAHSNGGLLAKKLINQLGLDAPRLVDEIVFVGVPQRGTPQAVGALLHGFKTGIPEKLPILLTESQARTFASTSPAMYNLLPHPDYYFSSGSTINEKLVLFEPGAATNIFTNKYGSSIDSINELHAFLRGDEGRPNPSYSDLIKPYKLYRNLITNSINDIASINGSWTPPAGIRIHQIAGVGVLTPYQIKYYTTSQGSLQFNVARTIDGDKTVVEPSALSMSTSSTAIRRWWLNIQKYNDINFVRSHADMLEIADIRSFIFDNIISTSTNQKYLYLSIAKPPLNNENRLSFTLHSPLALSYRESDGTLVNEESPYGKNSQFSRYGEIQIIDIYNGENGVIGLKGDTTGSFTLDIDEVHGDKIIATSIFEEIPSSTTTKASLNVAGPRLDNTITLAVDYEGNGVDDFSLEAKKDQRTSIKSASVLSPFSKQLLNQLKNQSNSSSTTEKPYLESIMIPIATSTEVLNDELENYNE